MKIIEGREMKKMGSREKGRMIRWEEEEEDCRVKGMGGGGFKGVIEEVLTGGKRERGGEGRERKGEEIEGNWCKGKDM